MRVEIGFANIFAFHADGHEYGSNKKYPYMIKYANKLLINVEPMPKKAIKAGLKAGGTLLKNYSQTLLVLDGKPENTLVSEIARLGKIMNVRLTPICKYKLSCFGSCPCRAS